MNNKSFDNALGMLEYYNPEAKGIMTTTLKGTGLWNCFLSKKYIETKNYEDDALEYEKLRLPISNSDPIIQKLKNINCTVYGTAQKHKLDKFIDFTIGKVLFENDSFFINQPQSFGNGNSHDFHIILVFKNKKEMAKAKLLLDIVDIYYYE